VGLAMTTPRAQGAVSPAVPPEARVLPAGRPWSAAFLIAGATAIAGWTFHNMDLLGDSFWYVATGRWLLLHRALPHGDPFSFASAGNRWMIGMPGSCVLFALIADMFGLRGLLVMATLTETCALVWLWLGAARTTRARLLLLPLALAFIETSAVDLCARGQVFGDIAFVALLTALRRFRDGTRVAPGLIVAGCMVWANLHYSYLLAFFVPVGVAVLLFLLEPEPTRPPLSPLLAVVPLAALGSLFNPYGWRYLPFTLGMMFSPITDRFDFYRSPDFHAFIGLAPPIMALVAVWVRGHLGPARCRAPEQVFLLVFIAAACNSRRWEPLLLMAVMGVGGPALDQLPAAPRLELRLAAAVIPLGLALGIAGFASGPDPLRDVPSVAAEVARRVQREREQAHKAMDQVINPLHWGGYLAYAWRGEPKYWHDGRDQTRLFANGVFEDSQVLRDAGPGALAVLDAYEAGVVLWERGSPVDRLLRTSREWSLIHEDWIAVVYERTP
jgi:hypothetical protein